MVVNVRYDVRRSSVTCAGDDRLLDALAGLQTCASDAQQHAREGNRMTSEWSQPRWTKAGKAKNEPMRIPWVW